MQLNHFPSLFFNHFIQPSYPTIAKLKSLHGVLRGQLPHKNDPIPLCLAPHLITSKSLHNKIQKFQPPQDKIQSLPQLLDPQGKPDHHCPTANFEFLSTGSITNSILITVFDTYLTLRSSGVWVWAKTLPILNVAS